MDDRMANAFRRWGFLEAQLDPLERLRPETHPELAEFGEEANPFRRFYCGSIGAEFMHIPDPAKRRWLQERLEAESPEPDRAAMLVQLIRTDLFEQVVHTRYLGNKRFSIKGVDALVPLLTQVLECAAERKTERAILAMSHRGRLNVVANVVGRSLIEVFAGFEDVDPKSTLGGGDVKYHLGATGYFESNQGVRVPIHLVSNPSHLEAVDPVALGRAKAWQTRLGGTQVLPVLMHGDAAFAGQGILAETLNLADLEGFSVGGTIHIIVNNLIGFTAVPEELHSSRFASEVAKRLPVPIFHVNAEDPDAVVRVGRLAVEYRYTFSSDVVVDLIGYRRFGHSEIDDPTITQPLLYKKINQRSPLWESYAEAFEMEPDEVTSKVAEIREEMDSAVDQAKTLVKRPVLRELPPYWDRFTGGRFRSAFEVSTGLSETELARLSKKLVEVPDGFHLHVKVERLLQQRAEMGRGERPADFAMAEALAFASLVDTGWYVRLTGQDSKRGTFNQRHSALVDFETGKEYLPLQHFGEKQGRFECYDSMLSEAAVLGFEYGFSRDYPEGLILWEAQFGDFANGAQIIIDQFIAAAEDKWDLLSGLVVLLPHGYEGQGPEHSSARVERFLQLAARDNIQVAQPSTAAQYFHLLRRQALREWRKPLIVFTPKSMLRHPSAASSLEEFAADSFQTVRPDSAVHDALRLLVCTGKIGHEIRKERDRRDDTSTAVLFLEQLYPFPEEALLAELERHPKAREIVWVQEEPANMGALFFVLPRIQRLAPDRVVRSVKRSAHGTPATGSTKAHQVEQKTLLALAFAKIH
jgi:2-oxoglutarate dehydrogenase E1 component